MIHLTFSHQVLCLIRACDKMVRNDYNLLLFEVKIYLHDNYGCWEGKTMMCLGSQDVHNFVEAQKKEVGIKNWNGYSSTVVPLSEHAATVIKRGFNAIK